eukprot:CAMPEP_0172597512 /NCGR_PEP_ID=MMETSP1068-20121228/17509_1 /TAXON_ID=35684 /ORGANISM="Pseudopedinella elastica, Strain CCMP716" /LENGTH=68 /DNA_ID=CAMNT_0013397055 /DNA_START=258 /DNA_END=464 /DNA_ORIENTATION=+
MPTSASVVGSSSLSSAAAALTRSSVASATEAAAVDRAPVFRPALSGARVSAGCDEASIPPSPVSSSGE